ncbi:hypothetical protein ABS71_04630, partial [bacterium SCN 62-11]
MLLLLASGGLAAEPVRRYVSPLGNDAWSGSLAAPDSSGKDGPFRTLERARRSVRELLEQRPTGEVRVELRGGNYPLDRPFQLGRLDGPQTEGSVSYAAFEGEKPILTGSEAVTGWRPLAEYPRGLPSAARGQLWWTEAPADCKCLYQGGRLLSRAQIGPFSVEPDSQGNARRDFLLKPGLLSEDNSLESLEVVVQTGAQPWAINILGLARADSRGGRFRTRLRASYPLKGRAWVENCWEGLDRPGTWMLDSKSRRLILWPAGGGPPADVRRPRWLGLLVLEDVRNVQIEGLTFWGGERETWQNDDQALQHDWDRYDADNALIRLRNANHCSIRACHLRDSGAGGIRLDLGCQYNQVVANQLERLGGTGILLSGYGPGKLDENHHNRVERNEIQRIGELYWHSPGIFLWQSGHNRIEHNRLHHLPYTGIVLSGPRPPRFRRGQGLDREQRPIRWAEVPEGGSWEDLLPFLHTRENVVEGNEVFRVVTRLADGNGIYLSGTGSGNLVRENYVHDLRGSGPEAGLRADDFERGNRLERNVVAACDCPGISLKWANQVVNNFLVDLKEGAYLQFG